MPDGQVSIRRAVISNVRVTPASQTVLQRTIHSSRPASDAGLERFVEGDQRIYRALYTLNTHSDCSYEYLLAQTKEDPQRAV